MSVTSKALWYIESHLSGELSLDSIAAAVGVSRYHLSRAFSVTVGCSLVSYLRARRLSEGARALSQGAPDILALALDSGYGSHEAFTRAFRQQFGVTPEQLRERGTIGGLDLMNPIRMKDAPSTALARPRIVRENALLVFGLGQRHQTNADIPLQWDRFVPYLEAIPNRVGTDTFGVICNPDDTGSIEYICGVQVSQFPGAPAEFSRLRIPPQTYAVFEHTGHVSSVGATWSAIWNQGLTDAGYEASDGPAFERYGEQFNPRTGDGGFEVWVPIRR